MTLDETTPVRVLRAVELIQTRPDMFFEQGRPSLAALMTLVTRDLTDAGCTDASIRLTESTAFIAASIDWMATDKADFADLWTRFVVPTPPRVNACRSEVLIAATCDGVRTEGREGSFSSGKEIAPDAAMRTIAGNNGRWLVFRLRS